MQINTGEKMQKDLQENNAILVTKNVTNNYIVQILGHTIAYTISSFNDDVYVEVTSTPIKLLPPEVGVLFRQIMLPHYTHVDGRMDTKLISATVISNSGIPARLNCVSYRILSNEYVVVISNQELPYSNFDFKATSVHIAEDNVYLFDDEQYRVIPLNILISELMLHFGLTEIISVTSLNNMIEVTINKESNFINGVKNAEFVRVKRKQDGSFVMIIKILEFLRKEVK